MRKTTFNIPKMDCSAEEQLIRMKLDGYPEIRKMDFDLPGRKLEVYHQGDIEPIEKNLRELNLGSRLIDSVLNEIFDNDSLSLDTGKSLNVGFGIIWKSLYV